jgi:hypothetical protein
MKKAVRKFLLKKETLLLIVVLFCFFGLSIPKIFAQNSDGNQISLAVTPPLFQVSVEPGGRWNSSVKMINGGKKDIEIYVTPINFQARGADGSARFIPIMDGEVEGITSAEWIDVFRGPYLVSAESSVDISFTVSVPEEASPGGHYAALLIGTEPADDQIEGSVVKVSSLVTALFLMRVEGDVVESGLIREFRTDTGWYNRPEARFSVNFQNTGTVHLQPRGVIEIYNMWDEKRGTIPINSGNNQFGNVLPDSFRVFSFRWEGENSVFEAGRYTANITLAYGTDGSKHVSDTITFWVLPLIPILTVLGIILTLIMVFFGAIRLYIKRVLAYEKNRLGFEEKKSFKKVSLKSLQAPIRETVIDMKRDFSKEKKRGFGEAYKNFVIRFRILFFVLFAVIFLMIFFYFFVSKGKNPENEFRIFEERPSGETEIVL